MIGIYKITNPKKEVYIGYSTNLYKRENYYKVHKGIRQTKLYNSIKKYGWDKHKFEIIEKCIKKELRNKEKNWIKHYNSFEKGLNSNPGGGGIISHTEKSKKLISEKGRANKGKRLISHWKGKSRGKKFARNMSLARKGKPIINNYKPVLQYDLQGNYIQEFPSVKDANLSLNKGQYNGHINSCCKGIITTAYKFKWKYKNESISRSSS